MKALVFDQFGGPEVLRYTDIPEPEIEPGTIRVRMKPIGFWRAGTAQVNSC